MTSPTWIPQYVSTQYVLDNLNNIAKSKMPKQAMMNFRTEIGVAVQRDKERMDDSDFVPVTCKTEP